VGSRSLAVESRALLLLWEVGTLLWESRSLTLAVGVGTCCGKSEPYSCCGKSEPCCGKTQYLQPRAIALSRLGGNLVCTNTISDINEKRRDISRDLAQGNPKSTSGMCLFEVLANPKIVREPRLGRFLRATCRGSERRFMQAL